MSAPRPVRFDAVILGAGFYGLRIAEHLRHSGFSNVLVVEAESEPMKRASFVNQARVHNGYHYPRSILTAFRSRVSSDAFAEEFQAAIVRDFQHVYAVASQLSKTSARQFEMFCERIGAPLNPAPDGIRAQMSSRLIEKSWVADEFAFDSRVLRQIMLERLASIGSVEIRLSTKATRAYSSGRQVIVSLADGSHAMAPVVISCLYAGINAFHHASDLPILPLQHELAEMALVRMPIGWRNLALTVMDGPFFSLVPFPSAGLHTLSHVRYTPQLRWEDDPGLVPEVLSREYLSKQGSTFREMKADVCRYVEQMEGLEYVASIREVKTVLARNDLTDSRPILARTGFGLDGYFAVLGGKIDNVGDVIEELDVLLGL